MRRNWLPRAAFVAVAISIPVTALSGPALSGPVLVGPVLVGPVFAGTAQAATLSGQQQAAAATAATPPKRAIKNGKAPKKATVTWNTVAAGLARRLVGDPYSYGGTSPAGFDCSGLTQFVYRHAGHGKGIRRTAEDQFLQFRPISHKGARPGDLVFFHETSDPDSYTYHVGVYEGGDDMVAATTPGAGVQLQSFRWAGDTVTFGTMTH
jgi:cell wall-associated NlpC family hydrolase